MALGIGQHVDPLHAPDGEAFIRILLVVKPIRAFRAGAQITLGRAPFFVQDVFHLVLKSAAQYLAEQHAKQNQQDGKEDDVTESQAEAKAARPSQSLARGNHMECLIMWPVRPPSPQPFRECPAYNRCRARCGSS